MALIDKANEILKAIYTKIADVCKENVDRFMNIYTDMIKSL